MAVIFRHGSYDNRGGAWGSKGENEIEPYKAN